MLAQNFKTPADLRLTDEQHRALVAVLGMLERGELKHHWTVEALKTEAEALRKYGLVRVDPAKMYADYNFGMDTWDCGTARCIGGWAEHAGNLEPNSLRLQGFLEDHLGLFDLLYANSCRTPLPHITTEQAAIALRSYLTTGWPQWE